jgi:hypothetical protein
MTDKAYVCGTCKRAFEGPPKGGYNTRSGEVVTCSGDCTVKGLTERTDVVSAAEMARLQRTN